MNFINGELPPKANGKKITNKDFYIQGWNAAGAGIKIEDCPYYASSTAEQHWKAGHRSA